MDPKLVKMTVGCGISRIICSIPEKYEGENIGECVNRIKSVCRGSTPLGLLYTTSLKR
jgi:hypothetical protein